MEENIQLQGVSLNIMDTAGIRETKDIVEKIGVDKAKNHANEADLIIYVVDASRELDENDEEIIEMIQDKQAIVLLNKSDLETVVTKENYSKKMDKPMIVDLCERRRRNPRIGRNIETYVFPRRDFF